MGGTTGQKVTALNRINLIIAGAAVLAAIVFFLYQGHIVSGQLADLETEKVRLEESIEEEKQRSKELEQLPAYVESREYIEKLAREKFGLVYDGEIVFKTAE